MPEYEYIQPESMLKMDQRQWKEGKGSYSSPYTAIRVWWENVMRPWFTAWSDFFSVQNVPCSALPQLILTPSCKWASLEGTRQLFKVQLFISVHVCSFLFISVCVPPLFSWVSGYGGFTSWKTGFSTLIFVLKLYILHYWMLIWFLYNICFKAELKLVCRRKREQK